MKTLNPQFVGTFHVTDDGDVWRKGYRCFYDGSLQVPHWLAAVFVNGDHKLIEGSYEDVF